VSLDLPSLAEQAERDPGRFLAEHGAPALIDEVQYAPGMFRHLKQAVDRDRHRGGQFILTGSQKFTLMREVSDSLAGRVALFELEPLSLAEIRGQVSTVDSELASTLARGLYPELWRDPAISSRDFHSSYLATYLERDVRQILNVTSLRDFERFMRTVAARSGQLLNKSDIAKDVGVSPNAINDWIAVLQASNQIALLEPYFQNIAKRSVKSPKVYFGDPGLLCHLLNLDAKTLLQSPYLGAVWETLLYAEMRKQISAHALRCDVYYYRDQRAREVDFVLDSGGKLAFVEAKWTEHPDAADARKITALDAELRASQLRVLPGKHAILCRTPHPYPIDERTTALPHTHLHELLAPPSA
jgi:predicted AAA+ superfamily ATPase